MFDNRYALATGQVHAKRDFTRRPKRHSAVRSEIALGCIILGVLGLLLSVGIIL